MFLIKLYVSLRRANERLALSSSTTRGIRNSQEGENCSKNNCGGPRTLGLPNRVLARISLVVPDSRHDQICTVDGDHAGLDDSRARGVFLNGGVNGHKCDDNAQNKVEGDEKPV